MKNKRNMLFPRRDFLKIVGVAAGGIAMQSCSLPAPKSGGTSSSDSPIPRRRFGKTHDMVSAIGVGGYALGLPVTSEEEAIGIVHGAIDAGINFMDNAYAYNGGKSEIYMGKALVGLRDRVFLQSKCNAHKKGKDAALTILEGSLQRLQTDHLDLWLIHQVNDMSEVEAIFAPGGEIEAFVQAKKQGKVRYVGFSGHKDPAVHLAMIRHGYPFDAVQLPINCFEPTHKGFRKEVLPELNKRGIAACAMKVLGGVPAVAETLKKIPAQKAIQFTMSQPVSVAIVGMSAMSNLQENLATARNFKPMPQSEMDTLVTQFAAMDFLNRYAHYHRPGYNDGDHHLA
jgi:uncharacterized protein